MGMFDGKAAVVTRSGGRGGIGISADAPAGMACGIAERADVARWNRAVAASRPPCFPAPHSVCPSMDGRGGGAVVHVSAAQGRARRSGVLARAAGKGRIHALARARAVGAARDGIRVSPVRPGSAAHADCLHDAASPDPPTPSGPTRQCPGSARLRGPRPAARAGGARGANCARPSAADRRCLARSGPRMWHGPPSGAGRRQAGTGG